MNVKLHDGFGHVAEAVESAATAHGHAHDCPLMRHLAAQAERTTPQTALLNALLGRDPVASGLASDIVDANSASHTHDSDVIQALALVCGGVDANVAVALIRWLDDECSIEGEDGSGIAWQKGLLLVQPADTGEILHTDGRIMIGMEVPATLAIAAAGRTLGEIIELPSMPASRRIASIETGDGETVIQLVA